MLPLASRANLPLATGDHLSLSSSLKFSRVVISLNFITFHHVFICDCWRRWQWLHSAACRRQPTERTRLLFDTVNVIAAGQTGQSFTAPPRKTSGRCSWWVLALLLRQQTATTCSHEIEMKKKQFEHFSKFYTSEGETLQVCLPDSIEGHCTHLKRSMTPPTETWQSPEHTQQWKLSVHSLGRQRPTFSLVDKRRLTFRPRG